MNEVVNVVCVDDTLDQNSLRLVQAACSIAGLSWTRGEESNAANASAIVAGLRPGERKVPSRAATLATKSQAKVVLVCSEPLVRPRIALQGGRVLLVGPPHGEHELASTLKDVIANRVPSEPQAPDPGSAVDSWLQTGTGLNTEQVLTREYLRRDWWVSIAVCPGGGNVDTPPVPQIRHALGQGVTAILPSGETPIDEERIETIEMVLQEDITDAEREDKITAVLEDRFGMLHLKPGAESWLVYWPNSAQPVWLLSPLRLPNVFSMNERIKRSSSRLLRFEAAGGDLMVATLNYGAEWFGRLRAEPDAGELLSAGGPALLDGVSRSLRSHALRGSAVLLEVR